MSEGRDVQEVRFGPIRAHAVSMPEAVDLIARRAASGRGPSAIHTWKSTVAVRPAT